MGYFSEDALKKFNSMCADGMDFAEESTYDFTRCVMPDGEYYGTDGKCKKGKPVGDKEKKAPTTLRKIMAAYERKNGKPMPIKLVAAAAKRIGVPIPDGMGAGLSNVSEQLKKSGEAAK
jgi:hypothetical protein